MHCLCKACTEPGVSILLNMHLHMHNEVETTDERTDYRQMDSFSLPPPSAYVCVISRRDGTRALYVLGKGSTTELHLQF